MTARVAHHFNDAHQQFHAATLGMWIFLGTEVMFFGGMFAGYTAYRYRYPEAFEAASMELHTMLGAVNTGVLLLSSLLVALSVHAAYSGRNKLTAALLVGAIVMGLAFLGIKAYEYADKWSHHRVPGLNWDAAHTSHAGEEGGHAAGDVDVAEASRFKDPNIEHDDPPAAQVQLFYSFYFAMTGLHAIHMVIGVVLLAVIAAAALRGAFSREYYTPVEVGGLYWHFVDIVWVFLFPLLYLIR